MCLEACCGKDENVLRSCVPPNLAPANVWGLSVDTAEEQLVLTESWRFW